MVSKSFAPYRKIKRSPFTQKQNAYQYDWGTQDPDLYTISFGASNSGPIAPIELKKIYKHQFWGYTNDKGKFVRMDRADVIEKCPSCGAGPISWQAIRNKRSVNVPVQP